MCHDWLNDSGHSLLTPNDWSREDQLILFPEKLKGNIEIRGKQNSLFLKGPVIK